MAIDPPDTEPPQITPFYTEVGRAIAAWSEVEAQLAWLFVALSSIKDRNLAFTIFDAVISFEARIKICSELLEYLALKDENKVIGLKILRYTLKQYKKRHELAHFAVTDSYGQISISPFFSETKFRKTQTVIGLTQRDIRQRGDRFVDLAHSIEWLRRRIRPRIQPGRAPKLPIPGLIARLQSQDTMSGN